MTFNVTSLGHYLERCNILNFGIIPKSHHINWSDWCYENSNWNNDIEEQTAFVRYTFGLTHKQYKLFKVNIIDFLERPVEILCR